MTREVVRKHGIDYYGPNNPSDSGIVIVGEYKDGEEIEAFFDSSATSSTRLIKEVVTWARENNAVIEEIQAD